MDISHLKMPKHIGVIMDGNGRWATKRGKPRIYGHSVAVKAVRAAIRFCAKHEICVLTLYAFSTENWNRPFEETDHLMNLLSRFIDREKKSLIKNNIKFRWIGRRDRIKPGIAEKLVDVEKITADNTGLSLNVALDYGSRDEIANACRNIVADVSKNLIRPDEITEALFSSYLYTSGQPDADLIIRTSGEKRVSNFLLWQSAYSEYCFFDEYWPEFNDELMMRALEEFNARKRRKGGLDAE